MSKCDLVVNKEVHSVWWLSSFSTLGLLGIFSLLLFYWMPDASISPYLASFGFMSVSIHIIWWAIVFRPSLLDFNINNSSSRSKTPVDPSNDGDYTLPKMRDLKPDEFEHFLARLWSMKGWSTEVTSSSKDKGIDVIAKKEDPYPQKKLIQAKKYSKGNKVSSKEIQQYSSLKHQEDNVDTVIVVTTSGFTRSAIERASDLNVKLIDGKKLKGMANSLID